MIEHEDDVRAYVRSAAGGKARWVEPALGSTPGLPDCWVPWSFEVRTHQVHLELKCATIKNGKLCYTVRPEQKRQLIRMHDEHIPAGFLVGVAGTHSLAFLPLTKESLRGKVVVNSQETMKRWVDTRWNEVDGFWGGVNFIFSDLVENL